MVSYDRMLAATYDALYKELRNPSGDREFYAGLATERGGPVLELGCGTGRVLLPIAEQGIECVGVDPSREMLDVFATKEPPANVQVVEGSMETLERSRLKYQQFQLAYTAFRGFMHLLDVDEQMAALTNVRDCLVEGGWFALDVFDPDLARMAVDEPDTAEANVIDWEGHRIRRHYAVRRQRTTQVMEITFRYVDEDTGDELGQTSVSMRWTYRYELEHLLWRAGFEPLRWLSDYNGRRYDGTGDIITVARRR